MDPMLPDLGRRSAYDSEPLDGADLGDDPIAALRVWLADARERGIEHFNAMAVATVDRTGQPTARNVLLRGIDESGRLEFFTNRTSRKALEMAADPEVGLLFSWLTIYRQVRIDGTAQPLGDEASDEYFAGRPRDSQLSAWASEQSSVIDSRAQLEAAMGRAEERFAGEAVPRPPHWGGYAVTPAAIEFWQGRPSRLHDRIRFRRDTDHGAWVRERLAP